MTVVSASWASRLVANPAFISWRRVTVSSRGPRQIGQEGRRSRLIQKRLRQEDSVAGVGGRVRLRTPRWLSSLCDPASWLRPCYPLPLGRLSVSALALVWPGIASPGAGRVWTAGGERSGTQETRGISVRPAC